MKTVLFCNSTEPVCGVYQYGDNLFEALKLSKRFNYVYAQPDSEEQLASEWLKDEPAAIIYNWHPDMGGWMKGAPFPLPMMDGEGTRTKQLLIYHDWQPETDKFDAVLFSDPTMEPHDNWHSIGRPVPHCTRPEHIPWKEGETVVVGVHGFYGAAANRVVEKVLAEFDKARIRLHLPFAHFGDADGAKAKEMAEICRKLVEGKEGIELTVNHDWMDKDLLLLSLSCRHLNCFLRDTEAEWRGVSSALDAALAVRRPIAVNKCKGFRHVFGCQPSICVEDRSLKEILATGIEPLKPLYEQHAPERVCAQVDAIISGLQ